MDAEPRYRLEVLDRVLQAHGYQRVPHVTDPMAMAWARIDKDGWHIGSFVPRDGEMTIRQDHVVAIAVQLGHDPADLILLIKQKGGAWLDPS